MPRLKNHADERKQYLSWGDARQLLHEVAAANRARITVSLGIDGLPGSGNTWFVVTRAWGDTDSADERPRHSVTALWPTPACETMVGMVIRQLHQIDHMFWREGEADEAFGPMFAGG